MDFTREPIIETIITPKESYKLVVRNSKGAGQEEFFVDAVEVVSFGHSFFFRSLERPKSFLVSVSDYEILEVRETRVVLKAAPAERNNIANKITNGKDCLFKHAKEITTVKAEKILHNQKVEKNKLRNELVPFESTSDEEIPTLKAIDSIEETSTENSTDGQSDRRRDRRRYRRRKNRSDKDSMEDEETINTDSTTEPYLFSEKSHKSVDANMLEKDSTEQKSETPKPLRSIRPIPSGLIPAPTTLISDTIHQYKDLILSKVSGTNEESKTIAAANFTLTIFEPTRNSSELMKAKKAESTKKHKEESGVHNLNGSDLKYETKKNQENSLSESNEENNPSLVK